MLLEIAFNLWLEEWLVVSIFFQSFFFIILIPSWLGCFHLNFVLIKMVKKEFNSS